MTNEEMNAIGRPEGEAIGRSQGWAEGAAYGYAEGARVAQAHISELEAQAALLAEARERQLHAICECVPGDVHYGDCELLLALQHTEQVFSNLPAAVQQHMERDRAAEDMADELWKFRVALQGQGLTNLLQKLAAYRAVGGEG